MNTQDTAAEVVRVLADRYEMLDILADGPATQAELARTVDVSRPTAHRVVTKFQEFDLVRSQDNKYKLTAFGRRLVDEHADYLETVERLCRLQTVQQQLSDDLSVESPVLADADAVFSDSYAFDAASYENKDIIEDSVHVFSVFDGMSSNYLVVHQGDTPHERVVWIVPDAHVDTLVDTYEEMFVELLETDFFELYKTTEPVPHTITVAETPDAAHAILMAHTDGQVTASSRNNSAEAVQWARNRIDHYLEDAEQIQLGDL